MDKESIVYEILYLCKKIKLSEKEKEELDYIFDNNIIDIDYDMGEFILSSAFFGNSDMINILKKHNANINICDNKPYRLAIQNNNLYCAKLLLLDI